MQKAGRLTTDHWTLPADFCFQLLVLTFLLLNQTLYPVVMATGQYLTEVALRLVERGHQVTVVTSRRAYDQPETQFQKTETWRGIRIYRVGSTGFGKGAKWRRAEAGGFCQFPSALLPAPVSFAQTRCGSGADLAAADLVPWGVAGQAAPPPLLLLGHGF